MTRKTLDVTAIGNALMDIIAPVPDAALTLLDIEKNHMSLVDEKRAQQLTDYIHDNVADITQTPGGSACNTIAGIASAAGKTAFIGKLASDDLGDAYAAALSKNDITYRTPRALQGPATGRSVILVSPDGARSMSTLLGISTQFNESDLNADLISDAKILYLEGYLFDEPPAKSAFHAAAKIAIENETQIALTLSDKFCVDRHKDDFITFIKDQCDIVFGNESEISALFPALSPAEAERELSKIVGLVVVTRGEKGASVFRHGQKCADQIAMPVKTVIDTTGAGDQFAAGMLWGLCNDYHPAICAEMGARAAADVIGHYGPRPNIPHADLFRDVMF